MIHSRGAQCYFPLLQVIANTPSLIAAEAYFAGILFYLFSYTYAVSACIRSDWTIPERTAAAIGLIVVVWVAWLLILYVNSLALRVCGFHRRTPMHRAQHWLIITELTVVSAAYLPSHSFVRWIAFGWLALVALNLAASLFPKLFDRE